MKIVCIGRNYLDHVKELHNEVPTEPVIFFKTEDSVLATSQMPLPTFTQDLQYECEVILKIDNHIPQGSLIDSIHSYCSQWSLGLDFTARDVQQRLKEKGLPWELSKSFKNACALGTWISMPQENVYDTTFQLYKHDTIVQDGHLSDMMYHFESIINYCCKYVDVNAGDILFTGTPAGVGKVASGDIYTGTLMGEKVLEISIL